ncbi:hypothetical protein C3747_56g74 [Trypanosoma cruzi]|uniref:Integral membrane bound transporter domain-containing protein n=2 Tax=Trypanosoma cruzi TaxID=5693 RepID=Q4DIW8_TRYCC|nr:hypothetical protein, conserved [Trypanosoma cruzi]EAN92476.1 hypothetical protein, conserved [Trypanosoma cruzi]PWV11819.1 hypothetical protein C3747_56g74 [Trypanosoma cruzi]RNC58897.1 hypothetical protein TcCL_ESM03507 [Trypanosoma cruzi]|eukprot:XP_814327.1 hypothetical protein [Trypanosoma cruzi strain CL Brener]
MRTDFSLEALNEANIYRYYPRNRLPYHRRIRHDHQGEMDSQPQPISVRRHGSISPGNSRAMKSKERDTEYNCSQDRRQLSVFDSLTTQTGGAARDSFGCAPYKAIYNFTTPPEAFDGGNNSDDDNSNRNKKKRGSSVFSGGRRKINCGECDKKMGVRQPDLDVPWELREAFSDPICSYFDFLGTKHFWFLVQFSARVTLIGMLIPAVIIALESHQKEYMSFTYTLPAVILGADIYVGGSAVFLVQFLKAGCIWLPLATASAALELHRKFVVWLVVYFLLLFFIACLTRNVTQRICLLLINISLVGQLNGHTTLMFPLYLLLSWLIGLLFGFAAILLPYPVLATRSAHSIIRRLFTNAGTAFRGLSTCFWAVSNTERSMGMVRIRHVTRSLDILLDKAENVEKLALYEFLFFENYERRKVRLEKADLLDNLRLNLRSMTRVIDIVQDNANIIDNSSLCIQFGEILSQSMEGISRYVEELLDGISEAQTRHDLLNLGPRFEACGRSIKKLQEEFSAGSRRLFYERGHTEMEEFVPLMTFFVFSVVNFWSALDEFHQQVRIGSKKSDCVSPKRVLDAIKRPFVNNVVFLKKLFLKRSEAEVRVLVEAGKISVAMLIALLFFYYVQPELLLLSGPTIIAFLSGVNPVHAVQGSLARLTGTLFGSVVGFFAASLCKTKVDFIISLCVITAVLTFFRTGQKFGLVCMYANFIAIPSLSIDSQTKTGNVVSRIQQNSFAIMIYCLIAVLVFPISPGKLLMKKRMRILQTIADIMANMMDFYREPLHNEPLRFDSQDGEFLQVSKAFAAPHIDGHGGGESTSGKSGNRLKPAGIVPTFIMMPERDFRISNLFDKVWYLRREMAQTATIMPFAADERGIKPFIYPQKACEAVHTALYRIFALVYTMVCSWRLMRDKGYFTPEVRRILLYLYPVANDIKHSLQRFVNLLSFYVAHPSSSLGSELTKCLLQFRALVSELSVRKHRAILAIIREAVRKQRRREGEAQHMRFYGNDGPDNGGRNEFGATISSTTVEGTGNATIAWERHRRLRNGDAPETIRGEDTSSQLTDRDVDGAVADAGNEATSDLRNAPNEPVTATRATSGNCRLPIPGEKERTGENGTADTLSQTQRQQQQQQQQQQGQHHSPIENVSLRFPSLSTLLDTDVSEGNEDLPFQGSVHFSESFTMPITVSDAEGLHSITLALDMMGKELKNALLAFEDMVQAKNY